MGAETVSLSIIYRIPQFREDVRIVFHEFHRFNQLPALYCTCTKTKMNKLNLVKSSLVNMSSLIGLRAEAIQFTVLQAV
jgi:hypothetical protein